MAEDTAVPVKDTPKIELLSNNNLDGGEENKAEVRVNETEPSMIEDETMPTYLSITSNASSLKPDDSKVQSNPHEADTDGDDIRSVYDVSSDDDGQGNNRALFVRRDNERNRGNRDNEDDEDDDDDDDDDDDEEDDNGEEDYEESDDSHMNGVMGRQKYRGESENEDIDDEEDEEDESDCDIEPELFERSSDDYVLRSTNSGYEKLSKERSRSLQDLSSPRKMVRSNSRRQVFFNAELYDPVQNNFIHNNVHRNPLPTTKYSHVSSKVKRYIQDIKEQNRRSTERRSSDKFEADAFIKNTNDNNSNQETDSLRINPQFKRLKNYAEYAMKNIAEDLSHNQSMNFIGEITPLINGDEIIQTDTVRYYEQSDEIQETMEIDDGAIQYTNSNNEVNKSNGTLENSVNTKKIEFEQEENGIVLPLQSLINGEGVIEPIIDVQTLTYEDYMKVKLDIKPKVDEVSTKNVINNLKVPEITIDPVKTSSNPSIQIKTVATNDKVPLENKISNRIISDNQVQITPVKTQKTSRRTDDIETRENYQKVINENIKLKKEIEELKKALAVQKNETKSKKMKIVAVQTEDSPRIMKHTSTTTHLEVPLKFSASTIPDVESTLSSIERWSDGDCSPAVSLKPPNVNHLLNSNNSTLQSSPKSLSQTSSRALRTTNRILQTLANMTPELPGAMKKEFDVPGQSQDHISPMIIDNKIRKRKASDNNEMPEFGPVSSKKPFTIPLNTSRKLYSASNTDGAVNPAGVFDNGDDATTTGTATATTSTAISAASQCESLENAQEHMDGETDDEDGVKCFVWHDDGDSKQRSCLIQAPIDAENSKIGVAQKSARECGPYLLGNLEVRITEANGTLNIWGKEVNHSLKSKTNNANKQERMELINDLENFWPKTPQTMVNDDFKCSTNKKIKSPSVRSNISRHLHGILNRTQSPTDIPIENHSEDMPNICQRGATNCNSSRSHKRLFSPTCHAHVNSENRSICCNYKAQTNIHSCGCRREHELEFENLHCHCEVMHHRNFSSHPNYHCGNFIQNQPCTNHLTVEENCKHAPYRRLSNNEFGNCCRYVPKQGCHSAEKNNYNHKTGNACCSRGKEYTAEMNNFNTPHSSNEVDPSDNCEKSHEIPEKRQRLRGKRVRNIMGFLTGCGDCRNSETLSLSDDCQIPDTETTNTRTSSSTRITSDPSSTNSYLKRSNHSNNIKECMSCVKHAGRAAELEAELEVIQVEISKLHSRSNRMRNLLIRHILQTDLNATNMK